MRKLHFTRGYPPYNTGEEATFDDAKAGQLVSQGVATYADPEPPVAVADDEPKAKAPAAPEVDKMVHGTQTVRKK